MSESKIELQQRKVRNGLRKEPIRRDKKEKHMIWRKLRKMPR